MPPILSALPETNCSAVKPSAAPANPTKPSVHHANPAKASADPASAAEASVETEASLHRIASGAHRTSAAKAGAAEVSAAEGGVKSKDEERVSGFRALGLREELLSSLSALGHEEPTPIQREAIPPFLDGHDVLGQAATGTGKTAAFALPILERLTKAERSANGPSALVLVPTRELAVQVAEAIYGYGRKLGVRVLPVYGGQPIGRQLRALERKVDVVVATPGRALDHIGRKSMSLADVKVVVLDEADEMLDMGFAEDIEAILAEAPKERQTVLFSATMPPRIFSMVRRHLQNPTQVTVARTPIERGQAPQVRQTAYLVPRAHKAAALGRVLDIEAPTATIVFCRTRTEVDELGERMVARGYRAEVLHGGMSQEQRERVMRRLRGGDIELIIATDVAARGLDIEQLTHVVNYSMPSAPEAYVHRIGRVGRAGRAGVALTLAEPREHRLLRNIERLTKQRIEVAKVPSVADLRARRLQLLSAEMRTALADDASRERFRGIVEELTAEFDEKDVALAALELAHNAIHTVSEHEPEIPQITPPRDLPPHKARSFRARQERPGRGFPDRGYSDRRYGERPKERGYADRGRADRGYGERSYGERSHGDRSFSERGFGPRAQKGSRRASGSTMRVFIGAGSEAGVRPQDLVGAIANEAGLSGRDIGAIEISERFSLVEVAEHHAAEVIGALRESRIKGRKVTVRREREGTGPVKR